MGSGALLHVEAALAKANHPPETGSGSEEAAFHKEKEEMPHPVLRVILTVKGVTDLALPAPSRRVDVYVVMDLHRWRCGIINFPIA